MDRDLARLRELLGEVSDLRRAAAVLEWDKQVNMPPGGAEARGQAMGAVARVAHQAATSAEVGTLLDALRPRAAGWDPDGDDARLVAVASRDFERAARVPASHVAEMAEATALAYQAWTEARAASAFEAFRPHLERVLALQARFIGYFPPAAHPYDVLLEDYEPGMTTADVAAVFAGLRGRQVPLIRKIARAAQVDDAFLHQPFDQAAQRAFGTEVITRIGYDWSRGRQDLAPHPFSIDLGAGDVRITTRVDPRALGPALFGTMHECGHALYSMGHAASIARTPLADGASMAFHESQSRLWENLVGRSLPFWRGFYPRLQETFPALAGVSLDRFYRGINRVEPSLIRVEADEATYNLHVMLRMELEEALVAGTLAVKDLPAAWSAKMEEYLGITPPDDARGVLQDVHWSDGLMGYFPTYALGNLLASQLWETMAADIPGLDGLLEAGRFGPILGWLREKVHAHGRKFPPQELARRVTGRGIDPAPYLRYLEGKFGGIYGL